MPTPSSDTSPLVGAPPAPIRWRDLPHRAQLITITLTRLSEPLVQTSLQSYMYYQLRWFDPSLTPAQIATQAGILHASFTFAQFLTAMLWGRLADNPHLGRKSVVLISLTGTFISSLGFAFSRSFPPALFFRALAGVTNGIAGVLRTMMGEQRMEKRYQTRAFLLLPMCYNIGVIVGPILGGMLADLSGTFPGVFSEVAFLKEYPYAPPNLLSAMFVLAAGIGAFLFLEETLDELYGVPDVGIHLRKSLARWWRQRRHRKDGYVLANGGSDYEAESLDDQEPGFSSASTVVNAPVAPPPPATPATPRRPRYIQRLAFRRIFTRNVTLVLISNFLIAFHLGSFQPLWVLFLSTPVYDPATQHPALPSGPHLPFKFTGGLGLSTQSVGLAMGIIGCLGLPLQLFVYAPTVDRWGPLKCFRLAVFCFPIAYLLIPYLSVIPPDSAHSPPGPRGGFLVVLGMIFILIIQVTGRTFALPSQTVLINRCSPHPSVLGTIHGLGQSISAGARTLGPIFGGWFFGYGLNHGVVGGVWWALSVVSVVGVWAAWRVKEGDGHEIWLEGDEEEE